MQRIEVGEMKEKGDLIVAIDQGTTGSTVIVTGLDGRVLARANREFPQHFPRPGWVEHDPEEIWRSVADALGAALGQVSEANERVIAVGITNQRETVVVWDSITLRPLHRALVWQDRRTSGRCAILSAESDRVKAVTGLVIDPYFSASKMAWLLNEVPGLRAAVETGAARMGTVDSYLVDKLSNGKSEVSDRHIIEVTNASRTLLMDLQKREWSEEMCEIWGVPLAILPDIVPSAGIVARTNGVPGLRDGIPIAGIAGDQHAALFGQGCVAVGDAKCTYGTGAFVLVNTGGKLVASHAGLLSTIGWQIGDEVVYALEGASFIAGAAVQWLRDGLGLFESAPEIESLADSVTSSDGVTFVPALAGLGAPYWDPDARGLICGITRGTTKAHLARATLEAIAFEVDDLLRAMDMDLKGAGEGGLSRLRVDGGASANNLLMQMQADFSHLPVDRPANVESTARGAALLAATGVGALSGPTAAAQTFELDRAFLPHQNESSRQKARLGWEQAVARTRS